MSSRAHGHPSHGTRPNHSLEERAQETLLGLDGKSPEDILEVVGEIIPELRSGITAKYLEGKIQKIQGVQDKTEQKRLCQTLRPYLDWYLQGL